MKQLRFAVIGCGARGTLFGNYFIKYPHEGQIVAIAEPRKAARDEYAQKHNVAPDLQFASWQELLAKPKFCDAVIITTSDRDHYGPAMAAMDLGYNVLLEKPMSHDPREVLAIARKAEETGVILKVIHPLRYAPFFKAMFDVVEAGRLGSLVAIDWAEDVSFWHYAASFVRGNWRNLAVSSPMILVKCCHDMDLIQALVGVRCTRVSSFGSLSYFRPENAPSGATKRCTDGCPLEPDCEYSAIKFYLKPQVTHFQKRITDDTSYEGRLKALQTGPAGQCVWYADNDVVDHQSVSMEFENGVTVSFTMSAFTAVGSRVFKLRGTKAELRGDFHEGTLEIRDFKGRRETIKLEVGDEHGGGDSGAMRSFVAMLRGLDRVNPTSARVSARSHLIAFAAEEARLTGKVIDMQEYEERLQ